jgi:MFS family permease
MLDYKMSMTAAASIMSATTASAIAGKLLLAWMADRYDLRILLAITAAFGMILCGTLLIVPPYGVILAVSLLTGLAIGGTLPLSNAIIAQRFGAASVGTAIGLMAPIFALSVTTSLYFVGATHDRTGNYGFAFAVFIVVCFVAMCLLPLVRRHAKTAA